MFCTIKGIYCPIQGGKLVIGELTYKQNKITQFRFENTIFASVVSNITSMTDDEKESTIHSVADNLSSKNKSVDLGTTGAFSLLSTQLVYAL